MDQQNSVPVHDPNDLSFNVMPAEGKNTSGGSSVSYKSGGSPVPPTPPQPGAPSSGGSSSRKWMYLIIGIIVLLALGGVAYYMLGNKTEEPQAVATKLPKAWLTQYFNVDTCADQATCGDDADPDKDGLKNYDEFKASTNPLNPDTDTDGLADGDEMNIYKTEPTLKYTDRREIVAQNNWTDGVQIKSGFDPLTPALPFTDLRKKQIADDTAKFKLHEPSISTTTSAASQTSMTTFNNIEFGFEVQYPNNYKVSPSTLALPQGAVLLLNLKDDSTKAGIRITGESKLDAAAAIKKYAPTGQEGVAPKTVKIGANTFSYYGAGGGGVSYPDQYFINLNARLVIFTFDGPYANDKTPSAAAKALETQVLTTFKFTTTDQTTNWKTYANTTYKYEFKYPTEIGYLSPEGVAYVGPLTAAAAIKSNQLILGKTDGKMILDVNAGPTTDTLTGITGDFNDRTIWLAPTSVTVGGVTFQKYVAKNGLQNGRKQFYVGTSNNLKYTIGLTEVTVAEQLLATFKFTK